MTDDSFPLRRRTFVLGLAGAVLGAGVARTLLGQAASAASTGFFDETTLWDAAVGPLACYHVHGLAVLPDDTILVATEGRKSAESDSGWRSLLLRRSTDKGATWQTSRTLVESVGDDGWANPTFVADRQTGKVFLFYGFSPANSPLYYISSTDGGVTWTAPRSLPGLFDGSAYAWTSHGPGPGHGIQLDNGRLLLNVVHRRGGDPILRGVSTIYSDDHGATWQAGGEIPVSPTYQINEARMVQRRDGTVLINGRDAAGGSRHRVVAVSGDRGLTWSQPKLDGSTGKFNAVDAGLIRYTGGPGSGEPDRILFSRPDAPVRRNMTVSVSYDEGHSFRYSRVISSGRSYYSDLARLSDGTIILVYGRDGDIPSYPRRVVVARFDLDWLTSGRDTPAAGPAYTEARTALTAAATVSAGSLTTVSDPVARSGKRSVWKPAAVGDYLEYGVDAPRAGSYDLLLRYFRPADGGLVEVTVNGSRPRQAFLDLTRERADGYDIAHLGTLTLAAGRNVVRFRLADVGRGGGTTISLDELNLVTARGAADVRNEVLVDDEDLGYTEHTGTWNPATGVAGYWGGRYTTHAKGSGDNVVRFRLVVPDDGVYRVEAGFTADPNRASNAPYYIKHATGTTLVRVDQRVAGNADPRGGQWVSLGNFRLSGGLAPGTTVSLSDDANGFVIADAIRLIRQ
jgi:hypothetical protein